MIFIVFPDASAPGKVRFFDALVAHGARIKRTFKGNHVTPQFIVEAPDEEIFAMSCGSSGRPVPTEPAKAARPA